MISEHFCKSQEASEIFHPLFMGDIKQKEAPMAPLNKICNGI